MKIKLNANHSKAYNNLATEYIYECKYELALYYLNQALNINPNYSKAYNNIGTVYLQKKEYKTALKNFSASFQLID